MTSLPRFAGKSFLIAGACSPALRAIGTAMADEGAHVALIGPSGVQFCGSTGKGSSDCRSAAPDRSAALALQLAAFAGDLTREAEIERLMDRALEELPGLDGAIVVIPAAADEPLAEMDLAAWERIALDPARGCLLICRRAVEEFLAARTQGRIVFVCGWPLDQRAPPAPGEVIELALFALARSIAKEYGRRGIASNMVAVDRSPFPVGPVTEAIEFLASTEASYVNGERLVVGGVRSA
jgi:NAD(P)-dependent dehydrogenase (short-subunit alcohol dehydrogenase family)